MCIRHFVLAVSFLTFAMGSTAAAQTTDPPKWTFGGTAGYGKTWDDESSIGTGWVLGGYADRKLARMLDVELSADVVRNKRTDAFRADGYTTDLSALLVGRFGPHESNFFLLGGPTVAIHRGTTRFADGTFHAEWRSTNRGWMFGTGLSFRTANEIEIAPLVRMTLMDVDASSDPWSTIQAGLRVGFGR